jgi:predicted metal-dependent phosphoesterase TrpH
MFGIDLHIHTDASPDGDVSVEEIFKKAKEYGINCLSITDHNDTSVLPAAEKLARKYNIEFIPGVEFNSNFNGRDIHILGYFINHKSEWISKVMQEIKSRKEEQARGRVQKLQEIGFFIEYEDALRAARGRIPNGSIFLDALLLNEKNKNNPVLKRYTEGDRSDSPHFNFYRDFFRYGKPAYVPLTHIKTERIIDEIRTNHALPVLAHPYDIPDEEIEKIIKHGIAGIEVYSSYHTEEQNIHFLKMARKYNLLITAGSDFHGSHKPKVKLGIFLNDGKEIIEKLKSASHSMNAQ